MSVLDYSNLKSIALGQPKGIMISHKDLEKLIASDMGVSADLVSLRAVEVHRGGGETTHHVFVEVKDAVVPKTGYDPEAKTFTFAEGVTFEVG